MIPLFINHNGYGGWEISDHVVEDEEHIPVAVALPLYGMPERIHLYKWMVLEEAYVAEKYGHLRGEQDEMMQKNFGWWIDYVFRYLSAANTFWLAATEATDPEMARQYQLRAQQAMAKAAMTAKDLVASSIRVFGNLPAPAVSSGEIQEWEG